MPGSTQGSIKIMASTKEIIEMLAPPQTKTPEPEALRISILKKNSSNKASHDSNVKAATQNTRQPLNKQFVNRLLARVKKPQPSTDAQAFIEAPNQSRRRP